MARSTATRPAGAWRLGRWLGALGAAVPAAALLSACAAGPTATPGVVIAVGAENQYADVLSQVGGRYVEVSSVLDDPNSDPHGFELSTSVAKEVGAAALVVQNGLGYDDFMTKIESATPNPRRRVLVVQHLLGLPDATRNPHLWYAPSTMPAVARAVAGALAALEPDHAAYFRARLERFDASLQPWRSAVAAFEARYRGVAVATTEPVADDLLEAMGADNRTPFAFQAAVMNGVDPSPQDISLVHGLLTGHHVRVLCVDAQVVSSLTASIRRSAARAGVPVVAVYETMPAPGYDFQRWMLAEVRAVERAVAGGVSTERL